MAVQGNTNGNGMELLKRGVIGTCACVLTMIFINALAAWLIAAEYISMSAAGYWQLGNLIASSVAGNLAAMRKSEGKKLVLALIVSAGYFLCLVILKLLCYPGTWNGVGVTLLVVAGCSIAFALLTSGQGRRMPKHKIKRKVL